MESFSCSTDICKYFASDGSCKYGSRCRFLHNVAPESVSSRALDATPVRLWRHDNQEVRSFQTNTQLCKYFAQEAGCEHGSSCQFRHDAQAEPGLAMEPSRGHEQQTESFQRSTELCWYFARDGRCRDGSLCRFYHDSKPEPTYSFGQDHRHNRHANIRRCCVERRGSGADGSENPTCRGRHGADSKTGCPAPTIDPEIEAIAAQLIRADKKKEQDDEDHSFFVLDSNSTIVPSPDGRFILMHSQYREGLMEDSVYIKSYSAYEVIRIRPGLPEREPPVKRLSYGTSSDIRVKDKSRTTISDVHWDPQAPSTLVWRSARESSHLSPDGMKHFSTDELLQDAFE